MSLFAVAASRGARTIGVAAGVSQARIAAAVVTVQPKLMMMSSVADRDNILPVSTYFFCFLFAIIGKNVILCTFPIGD
jgi:hypothetical protein